MRSYFLLVAAFVLTACENEEPVAVPQVRPVIVETVAESEGGDVRTFSGVLTAVDSTTLSFEVGGRITRIVAKEGRRYSKGDILAQLDVANLQSQLRSSQAAALKANEELKRIQQLYETENESRANFDSAIADQQAAQAALEVAQKDVADGTLYMPYDGVIEDVTRDEQNVVTAGMAVMTIQGSGAMKARVGVPANIIGQVSVGMKSRVHVSRLTDVGIAAEIERIYPLATDNGTYEISMLLEESRAGLFDGMDVEAELRFSGPNPVATVSVDIAAVAGSANGRSYVWVIGPDDETRVLKREVTLGDLETEGRIRVLSGLEAGEQVVVRGVHQVVEGATVIPIDPS